VGGISVDFLNEKFTHRSLMSWGTFIPVSVL